jgi:type I restriction enzyme R subunit
MTTGVDAQTCKFVVLDQNIQSMTKFKQIIGRGTRINDKYGKLWFTILDFKKATELFADERFDGIPERVMTVTPEQINEDDETLDEIIDGESQEELDATTEDGLSIGEPDADYEFPPAEDGDHGPLGGVDDDEHKVRKFHVNGVTVKTIAQRVQYYDADGKLVTESFQDYTRKTFARQFASLDDFTKRWNNAERKQAIIDELANEGIIWEVLEQEVGKDLDPFDLICHVVYDQPPLTRRERANEVRKRNYFTRYSDTAQTVLNALLDKYADAGVQEIESMNVLKVQPLDQLGNPMEIVKKGFGSKQNYLQAISELEAEIYQLAPKKQA